MFVCLTVRDHVVCISLGLRMMTDTGCSGDVVGHNERSNVKTTSTTRRSLEKLNRSENIQAKRGTVPLSCDYSDMSSHELPVLRRRCPINETTKQNYEPPDQPTIHTHCTPCSLVVCGFPSHLFSSPYSPSSLPFATEIGGHIVAPPPPLTRSTPQ